MLTGTGEEPVDRWAELPESSRARVVRLLAGLIARGVLIEDGADAEGAR